VAIILTKNSRVLVQGITGTNGKYQSKLMKEYGTNVVAGVTPGRGGERVNDIPVYDTVEEAVLETGADLSVTFIPESHILDALLEAVYSGIKTVICMPEFVPVHDAVLAVEVFKDKNCRLIGPNVNGIFTPGQAKVGFFPKELSLEGPLGIISKSGTLSYGALLSLHQKGIGQSTIVGLGGNAIKGTKMKDCLLMFNEDTDTEAIVVLGEIGGTEEEELAELYKEQKAKPVYAYIAGRTAPKGKAMGHAGAIVSGISGGSYQSKIEKLTNAGIPVAKDLDELASMVSNDLKV